MEHFDYIFKFAKRGGDLTLKISGDCEVGDIQYIIAKHSCDTLTDINCIAFPSDSQETAFQILCGDEIVPYNVKIRESILESGNKYYVYLNDDEFPDYNPAMHTTSDKFEEWLNSKDDEHFSGLEYQLDMRSVENNRPHTTFTRTNQNGIFQLSESTSFSFGNQMFGIDSAGNVHVENDLENENIENPLSSVLGRTFWDTIAGLVNGVPNRPMEDVKVTLNEEQVEQFPVLKWNKEKHAENCAICLEDYDENSNVRQIKCNHVFHPECIDKWLMDNSTKCPVCRAEVDKGTPQFSETNNSIPNPVQNSSINSHNGATERSSGEILFDFLNGRNVPLNSGNQNPRGNTFSNVNVRTTLNNTTFSTFINGEGTTLFNSFPANNTAPFRTFDEMNVDNFEINFSNQDGEEYNQSDEQIAQFRNILRSLTNPPNRNDPNQNRQNNSYDEHNEGQSNCHIQ